ncbi:MAG: hypothetical protein AAGC55_12675 [Myxococcota bacterium]
MSHEQVQSEIVDLHEFFVEWFTGSCESSDAIFAERFTSRFTKSSILIPPGGQLMNAANLGTSIRAAYGKNPAFRIAIRNVAVRREQDGLLLATYEEWQRGAIYSSPPENGRLSTALFEVASAAPGGLRWLHIHETWLPAAVMAAGPYDF